MADILMNIVQMPFIILWVYKESWCNRIELGSKLFLVTKLHKGTLLKSLPAIFLWEHLCV